MGVLYNLYMNRKFVISTNILLLSTLCILSLSRQAILLSILLMLIAYAKHRIYPIKKELLWFVFICVSGVIVEIILVNFGRAWNYSTPQFFGIPVYMPIFWGLLGTTIIVIYDGLIDRK